MKTSVPTSAGVWFTSAWMSSRQKAAVSCSKFSATTSHLSFDSAATTFFECGPLLTGFMPKANMPSMSPRNMRSNM